MRYPSTRRTVNKADRAAARTSWRPRGLARPCPPDTPPSQPYWLRDGGHGGAVRRRRSLAHRPPREPARVPGRARLRGRRPDAGSRGRAGAGRRIPPSRRCVGGWKSSRRSRCGSSSGVRLFAPGAARPVTVELTAARAPHVSARVQLDGPAGWTGDAGLAAVPTRGRRRPHARFTFTVTAPAQLAARPPSGRACRSTARRFDQQRVEIRYDHIPPQLLQPPARAEGGVARPRDLAAARSATCRAPATAWPSAWSRWATRSRHSPAPTSRPSGSRPRRGGHRRPRLQRAGRSRRAHARALRLRRGRAARSSRSTTGPTACGRTGSRRSTCSSRDDRVTDEHAPVTFLAPDHPALTTPNKITAADFEGWVQERGIYFPTMGRALHADPRLRRPGRAAAQGRPLVAKHGKGYFVYTGLALFRQLPAGVPAPIGCSRTWSRWANDAPDDDPDRPALRRRGRRRTRRPACRGRAPGRGSTCSCSAASSLWVVLLVVLRADLLMNLLDFVVLLGTMVGIAAYGAWRTRGRRSLELLPEGRPGHRLGDDRPLGDGHAGQRHHLPLHARPGLRGRPRLRPELLRAPLALIIISRRLPAACTGG